MQIATRSATHADIPRLVTLYRAMEAEQTERKPIWARTDGLDQPFDAAFAEAIDADESWLIVGSIDDVTVGFARATITPMLRRAEGARIGTVTLIFTEADARGVGVGHAMLEHLLDTLRAIGITLFDAPVGPGQRQAKNFFEAHGFAARSIIMHHADA